MLSHFANLGPNSAPSKSLGVEADPYKCSLELCSLTCIYISLSLQVHAGSISSRQSDNNGQEEKMLQFPRMECSEDPE